MKFRAILVISKKLERPIQCYGNELSALRAWARDVLDKYPTGRVDVYFVQEDLIETIAGEKLAIIEGRTQGI